LETLLVHLEITATTNRSTIVKTHVFSLYSHLCIYVSRELPFYALYIWTGCRQCMRAIRGVPADDNGVNSEIHYTAVIEDVWRCTCIPRSSELRDALGAMIEQHSRCTGRQRWSGLIYTPIHHD
jgi:hypothetical protein